MNTTPPNLVGTVLLVSRDAIASRQLTDAMQQLAASVEVCADISAAADSRGNAQQLRDGERARVELVEMKAVDDDFRGVDESWSR